MTNDPLNQLLASDQQRFEDHIKASRSTREQIARTIFKARRVFYSNVEPNPITRDQITGDWDLEADEIDQAENLYIADQVILLMQSMILDALGDAITVSIENQSINK